MQPREIILPSEKDSISLAERRSDITALSHLVEAAKEVRNQMDDETHLKLSIMGEIGVVGTHVVGGVGNAVTGNLGIQITLPIFDGSFSSGRTQEASVKATKEELQYKQTNLEAKSQVK